MLQLGVSNDVSEMQSVLQLEVSNDVSEMKHFYVGDGKWAWERSKVNACFHGSLAQCNISPGLDLLVNEGMYTSISYSVFYRLHNISRRSFL